MIHVFCVSFSVCLLSTPPACGPSIWPTADQIPTTLQRNRKTLDSSGLQHWRPSNRSSSQSAVISHSWSTFQSFLHLLSSTISLDLKMEKPNVLFVLVVWRKTWGIQHITRSHVISQDVLFLQFPQALDKAYHCKSHHWCREFIWCDGAWTDLHTPT